MKSFIIGALLAVVVSGNGWTLSTDVAPDPTEVVTETTPEDGQPAEEQPQEEAPTPEIQNDKVAYHEGDEPIFIYVNGNFIAGYYASHEDGSLTSLSEEEYVAFCKNYCEANNKTYYDHFGKQVRSEELATYVADRAREYYPNYYIAAQKTAIDVDLANSIPEDIYWYDINRFEDVEDDGYHYYLDRRDMTFHRVSEKIYSDYINKEGTWYEEKDVTTNIYSVGYGSVQLKAECSPMVDGKSVYLTYTDDQGTSESIILNPPDYNAELILMTGEYTFTEGGLYNERNYPLDVDLQSFHVVEGKSIPINVSFAEVSETMRMAEYTPDDMASANQAYATAEDFVTSPDETVYPEAQFSTDGEKDIPVKKSNGIFFWVVIGGVGVIVIGGIAVLLIRKHQNETY